MANKPLKLVYCTPALYMAGGVERVLTLKANYFAEHYDYDITIILTEGKDKLLFYPLSRKVKIVFLDINFEELWNCSFLKKVLLYLPKQFRYRRLLRRELKRIRPDVTVSLLRREINFINSIKDGSRKIGEIHVHRANYRNFQLEKRNVVKDFFAKVWSRNLVRHLKKLDRLVVLTEQDKKSWVELNNVEVIANPLPFDPSVKSFLPKEWAEGGSRVIAIARYSHEKGIDLLLQAWAKVEKRTKFWRLDVFGEGDHAPYESLIDQLGIDRYRCTLHGRTTDVEYEYTHSSIAVCSSRFEGFGMVMVESMACGLPVVAFDCPWGPRAIIDNGENGILVENGNVDKMADVLVSLINNPQERMRLSQAAMQHVQQYRIEHIAEQWKTLFESIVTNTN